MKKYNENRLLMPELPPLFDGNLSEITKFQTETIEVLATPLNGTERTKIKQSKFLGKPYLPIELGYPMDNQGKPMILIAQINFSEIPYFKDYPEAGILQLFLPESDWICSGEYRILYHKNPNKIYHKDFSFLKKEMLSESPIQKEYKLSFRKKVEYGGIRDFNYKPKWKGELSKIEFDESEIFKYEVYRSLFFADYNKIGGYAIFTQSDPREDEFAQKDDILLLQIVSDDIGICIGDMGVIHIFINKDDLKIGNFEKAYFHWDCG